MSDLKTQWSSELLSALLSSVHLRFPQVINPNCEVTNKHAPVRFSPFFMQECAIVGERLGAAMELTIERSAVSHHLPFPADEVTHSTIPCTVFPILPPDRHAQSSVSDLERQIEPTIDAVSTHHPFPADKVTHGTIPCTVFSSLLPNRRAQSSVSDLERQMELTIERNALLEYENNTLEVELQHLREELRGMKGATGELYASCYVLQLRLVRPAARYTRFLPRAQLTFCMAVAHPMLICGQVALCICAQSR